MSTYNNATTKEFQNGIWLTTADIGKRLLCPDIDIGIDKIKVVFPITDYLVNTHVGSFPMCTN